MRFIAVTTVLILFLGLPIRAEENLIQDFSVLFNGESDDTPLTQPIIYKGFTILIFGNSNGFRFETYRILKINGHNVRSDKAVKYFGQGFQQYYWDTTNHFVGITDYFIIAGNTYRGWGQNSRATHGQMLPWMTFRKGQIVYVSYEYEREWAWAQNWHTQRGAENAAKLFIDYVSK